MRCSFLFIGFILPSCFYGAAFDPVTARELAKNKMRTAQAQNFTAYFPEGFGDDAQRVATRLDTCLTRVRQQRINQREPENAVVVIHNGELNNAYVTKPLSGTPQHMVLPMHVNLEIFNLWDIGVSNVFDISCHEAVHYVVTQEVHGFWRGFNTAFGAFMSPVAFLPQWFQEGLATYYESRLGKTAGRMNSPLWRGQFAAGVAADHGAPASILNAWDRSLHGAGSGAYLVGSHFITFLADRYGEQKLWELIDLQAHSFWSWFGVTLRFSQIYGRTIGELFEEFRTTFDTHERLRPESQHVVAGSIGYDVRLAACPRDNIFVVVHGDAGSAARFTLYEGNGKIRWSHRAADVLPMRQQISGAARAVSGLSFSGDCQKIFFTLADQALDPGYTTVLWQLDMQQGQKQNRWGPFNGLGGGVDAAADRYAYVVLEGAHARLAVLDLKTGTTHIVNTPDWIESLGSPVFSPDGTKIAFAGRTARGFNLFVYHDDAQIQQLTDDAFFNYQPRWINNDELLFIRGHDGRLQLHAYALRNGVVTRRTDAPYAVLDGTPWHGDSTLFLSAESWAWNVEVDSGAKPEDAAPHVTPTRNADADAAPPMPAFYTDAPYTPLSHLGWPVLRVPWVTVAPSKAPITGVGAAIFGQDTLAYHRYTLKGAYAPYTGNAAFELRYWNAQNAPWNILSYAAYNRGHVSPHPTAGRDTMRMQRRAGVLSCVLFGRVSSYWVPRLRMYVRTPSNPTLRSLALL